MKAFKSNSGDGPGKNYFLYDKKFKLLEKVLSRIRKKIRLSPEN
jgi:hypothetical protein